MGGQLMFVHQKPVKRILGMNVAVSVNDEKPQNKVRMNWLKVTVAAGDSYIQRRVGQIIAPYFISVNSVRGAT